MKQIVLRALARLSPSSQGEAEEPIRAELFGIERLEQHAASLAVAQQVTVRPASGRRLMARLRDNGRVLLDAYRSIGEAIREERAITPAAEWLVDNFHVVEDQIREIRDDLPRSFYRQLPKLVEGPLEGYPRIFGVAWAYVAHTDSRFDPHTLCRFVHAYQRVDPLTIGELWAVAIALRIVLVENMRRSAELIVGSRAARQEADALADALLGAGDREPEALGDALRRFEERPLPRAFVVQLAQRLREHDPTVTPLLHWLDARLAAQGTTAQELVREEHQRQGAMNVTVRNVVTSMRLLSAFDWADFFEEVSLVDQALRAGSQFGEMDFPTRDRYRHAIEELARGSHHSELHVARRAILATRSAPRTPPSKGDAPVRREEDPGYYLLSRGRLAFERELGFRVPLRQRILRADLGAGMSGYLGTVATLAALILAAPLTALAQAGVAPAMLVVLALLALVPASDAALALAHRSIMRRVRPLPLPGLELRGGVPATLRTLVVVPTLLTSREELEGQLEALEVHSLASPDDDLRFVLLSDWVDADAERVPGDDALLDAAVDGIARLNRRHGPARDGDRFLLLHRRRVFSASEGRWIGWERKRGKLHELNRLLRGADDTTFLPVGGRPCTVPPGVRYVITLDADTRLPRGVARRLVGKMAHPLNRPRLDPVTRRVVEGHAVLQPRVTPSLPVGREGSLFQRVFSGPGGMDPYAFVVSDVYQDFFGEGSYSGKGIYDVDAFAAALEGRIPDETVLSHDLLEGIFARAGLASDVEVVEEYPARYEVAAARLHRWARGDWQLLPWILGRGPAATASTGAPPVTRSGVPAVGRWKMIDNLRRTLSAPATFLALVAGFTLEPASAVLWTGFLLATLALPPLLPFFAGLLPRRRGISKRSHLRGVGGDLALALSQVGFLIGLLAQQSWLMGDAIARTLFRLRVRRRLLEWVTAAQARLGPRLDLPGYYRWMSGGLALGVAAGALVAATPAGAPLVAAPFVLAWLLAPALAHWASLPTPAGDGTPVSDTDARSLRLVARRTWRFFERFVTAEDHDLPPDNFQEDPKPVVAHRTSPTNVGLYLLSVVAARDFGWLGTFDTVERLEATFATLDRLERHRGHLFNWYDTRDLRPLDPRYVSSVDSGNLAGHLVALASACREAIDGPAASPRALAGIADAVALARESLRALSEDRRTQTVTRRQLEEALDALIAASTPAASTPAALAARLAELAPHAETAIDVARTIAEERRDDASVEALAWAEAVRTTIRGHQRDLERLMPWTRAIAGGESPDGVLDAAVTLSELPERRAAAIAGATHSHAASSAIDGLERASREARDLGRRLAALAERAAGFVRAMEFGFLLDPSRQLLSIGYRCADGTLDPSCYDLLASEARLASFVAIAKGDVPVRHWFRLGRSLTPVDRGSALVSWSGSMFEYLMPSLVMRAPAGSLLEQTNRLVVRRQRAYGAELGVPWGVSESAYNARDIELTYQYSNFGVPGLGLKRGLSEDAVIAPYATALAAMVDPQAAARNFERLAAEGGCGRYGYYEALDYTPSRLPEGTTAAVVGAYMAHHQGMTVVAIADALLGGVMRSRFHADPIVRATELLLQERTPRDVAVSRPRAEEVKAAPNVRDLALPMLRRFRSPHDVVPRTHLLSNGHYSVMVTAAGSGYSRWGPLAVTRWREDVTCDAWGSYVFLRDARSGAVWSAAYQPSGVEPDFYEAIFSEDRVEIVRRDGSLATTIEVAVSAEDDGEVRRVSISNLGGRTREIELTSYAELVLATPAADAAHPAFSKLFVQTEYVSGVGALLATRRRRSPGDPPVWAAHVAVVEGESVGDGGYETDRARFLGRGHTVRTPVSVIDGGPLSNSVGTVLDPIFSLRRRVRISPGETARVAFWTLLAPSRDEVLDLVDKHEAPTAFERAVTLAWTQAHVQLHHLGVGPDEARVFQRLANRVLYSDPSLRVGSDVLSRSLGPPSALWPHGISGDVPIVLVRIDDVEDLEIVREMLRAHEYWRMKRLAVDLVILNERASSYLQDLQGSLEGLVRASQSRTPAKGEGAHGAAFVLRTDLVSEQTRGVLRSAARAVLLSRRGSLAEQVKRIEDQEPVPAPRPPREPESAPEAAAARPDLEFFNGLGGFAADGREYVTILGEGQWTPAPWINVVANPGFGFQVSAEGGGYTWAGNSRENQITPWSNDPVGDRPGEVLYVRDEDNGALFGPTALPIRDEAGPYVARHGQGYTRFEHASHGISLELLQYVAPADPIKISRLTLRNRSARTRRLSVTAYVEWALAASREVAAPFLVTEIDEATGAFLARNPWSLTRGERVAFADLAGRQLAVTGDRTEFLGRNGTLARPAALAGDTLLSGRVGAGLDPCAALQTWIELRPNERVEVVFLLGDAPTREEARALVARYRTADLDATFRAVVAGWDDVLERVQVKTPDRSLDLLLDRWLLYQTLACRVWARSAFYQASGAYGFRDQLQDGMALVVSRPALTREHLLRAAARQFAAGDVQHWWLPASGQGVRTRFADDAVWLPYAAAHYLAVTADRAVLDEPVPFLEGPELRDGEHESFFEPTISGRPATLYEHCARGLERSLEVGSHGLPLFGGGDWNDGMNRVGVEGKGESVWLGWFLHATLEAFAPLAEERGDAARATAWRRHALGLRQALEGEAWDGAWYRRGYFDDGTPLGSASSDECRIDSIAQSWGVISGAADAERAATAMASLEKRLVRREDGLVLLFTPPFDRTPHDPGYIKGYPPGIRENGGQYTHAAVWVAVAWAMLGDGDRAAEVLSLLNPIHHASTRAAVHRYKAEPYVTCADVYAEPPHVGRGGWTWYTGSAAWMYRAGLEWILGFRVRGTWLEIDPCVPKAWPRFEIAYRHGSARYEIAVENPAGVSRGVVRLELDGAPISGAKPRIPLADDGAIHRVRVVLG
ncbi:MAG TPA: glucoamylase family protein [Myxococcota bacterium]|nr:glucoamylase family protein [Myxococcota bacterium]